MEIKMKDDKILIAYTEDKIAQCEDCYMPTHTDFLDMHQRSVVERLWQSGKHQCRMEIFGGYDDSERSIAYFLPDYAVLDDCHELVVARVKKPSGSRDLSHRDYLGSLLGMGIKRDKVGDILVDDHGADIILLEDLSDFILLNYDKAGRTNLTVEILPLNQLKKVENQYKEVTDTLASLRLDNVISSAFGTSRTKAVEAIKRGLVFLNNLECTKPDKEVHQGDKLVLRGKGKAYLSEIGGKSRKDRIYVTFKTTVR